MKTENFEYSLERIDDKNVMELLNSVNFQGKDYMFGTLMPKLSSYAM